MRIFLPEYGITVDAESIEEAVAMVEKPEKKKKATPPSH